MALLMTASVGAGCRRDVGSLVVPHESAVAMTGGSNTSMIYVARTTEGVLAIDLGWWGHKGALAPALSAIGATAQDVRWVFLTHSHRDHIAAWPTVRHAMFYLGAPEQSLLVRTSSHRGWIPRWTEWLKSSVVPRPGQLDLRSFAQDTAVVIGADTIRAYLVPGHTPGSVVYLFRGVLFLGDAVTWSRRNGFAPARHGYSDDPRAGAINLERLWTRLPAGSVRYACTAHARCARFTPGFQADAAR